MDLPIYVTKDEVQRVCRALGLQDWTELHAARLPLAEVGIVRGAVGGEALDVSLEAFQQGLEVELEHGLAFPDANVTNNHPVLTGRIVLAHLKESLAYYLRLAVAELEGDLSKAIRAHDAEKTESTYHRLVAAKHKLWESEITPQNHG